MSKPPPPPASKRPMAPPSAPVTTSTTGPRAAARAPKTFSVKPWTGDNEGEKIVIYGNEGMGKSSLALLLPDTVWFGFDDGARKLRHPVTGQPVSVVDGVDDFYDFLDALATTDLYTGVKTVVIDTITKLQDLADEYMFDQIKTEKGIRVTSIEGYGYGKGYRHAVEVLTKVLQDVEVRLIKRGINVVILAQSSAVGMPNAEGLDFLVEGPKLHHSKNHSCRQQLCEWADHVLRIGFATNVVAGEQGATKGKVLSRDTDRVIYTSTARHAAGKSRTLKEPVISFGDAADDSLWQFLFPTQ